MNPLYFKFFKYLEDIGEQKIPLEVKLLNLDKFELTSDDLHVKESLNLSRTSLTSLPDGLKVDGNLDLSLCTNLTSLPDNLEVGGYLALYGCTSLTSLPDGLKVDGILDVRKTFLASKTKFRIRRMIPGFKGKIWK